MSGIDYVHHQAFPSLISTFELKDHPWYVGVQYHPELKSTVEKPHPLFVAFVKACIKKEKK